MDEHEIERMIVAKGNPLAPRLRPEDIDKVIVGVDYARFPDTTVTVCCLKLANGYCVVGHSAAAAPENFDKEVGERVAYLDARTKIWALEGYLLKQQLFDFNYLGMAKGAGNRRATRDDELRAEHEREMRRDAFGEKG
jgi:hypothetical protein